MSSMPAFLFMILYSLLFVTVDLQAETTSIDPFELVNKLAEQDNADTDEAAVQAMIPTDRAIEMFEVRVAKTSQDFRNRTVLGQLYLRDAKENDNLKSFSKAEEVLRTAIKNGPDYLPAWIYLAQALQAQHQFRDALELSEKFVERKPTNTLGLATLGDSQIELGQYEEAKQTYEKLHQLNQSPAVVARLAHLDELHGNTDNAIHLMQQAIQVSKQSGALPDTQAWFEMRIAHLYFSQGELKLAEQHFLKALELSENFASAMTGMVLVKQAQGDSQAAISLAEKAYEVHEEPPMMAILGDLNRRQDDIESATKWYDRTEAAMAEEAKVAASAHYREYAMFLLDHERNMDHALELLQKDFEMRPSIASHDALAWALHKTGDQDQALKHSIEALKLGTRNASFHYHAAKIHEALGHTDLATNHYKEALAINPGFSITQAKMAQDALSQF